MRRLRRFTGSDGGERGATMVMVIGFAAILIVMLAVVVDASAAYLHRQGLDNLADGAALQGADSGAVGAYTEPLEGDHLTPASGKVKEAVHDYLVRSGAFDRFPGLTHEVSVNASRGTVTVVVKAPLELPLRGPGMEAGAVVSSSATAAVVVER